MPLHDEVHDLEHARSHVPVPGELASSGLVMLLALALTACDEAPSEPPSGTDPPDESRVPGMIEHSTSGHPFIEVPDSIGLGQVFQVRVLTTGNGCVRKGDTNVQLQDRRAWVTPYDIHEHREFCTDIGNVFDHRANVRFTVPGIGHVIVRGRKSVLEFDAVTGQSLGSYIEFVTIVKTVVVH